MKTLRLIGMALFAVLMCVNFASCSSEEDVELDVPQKPKEYMVSLGFTGEISVSESPLSRTEPEEKNDLYGFMIYSCPNVEGKTTYEPYAHGLFDDITSLKVKLLEGYKYKFTTTMIVNGKKVIRDTSGSGSYTFPFIMNLAKDFYYSDAFKYYVECPQINDYEIYTADRYYGETAGFIPSEENSSVGIYMKRVVFGAKFVAENLTEGTLYVSLEKAPYIHLTPDENEYENIFTLRGIKTAYESDDYVEDVKVNLKWKKEDEVYVPLGEHTISFKRNKLTTVTIKVADLSSDKNISIELEDEEMGEGDNITIENGKIIDTNVNTGTEE